MSYTCPAGKIPTICKLKKKGYWLDNCPLIKSGIFKPQVFPIYNDFYQLEIVKDIYILGNEQNFRLIPQKQTFHFWEMFSGLFQIAEKAYSLFGAVKTLCGNDATSAEKALAVFESFDIFNGITYNNPKEDKKALARIGIDFAKDKALELIKNTKEYQNAADKNYIVFGIQLAAESAKIFAEEKINLL